MKLIGFMLGTDVLTLAQMLCMHRSVGAHQQSDAFVLSSEVFLVEGFLGGLKTQAVLT